MPSMCVVPRLFAHTAVTNWIPKNTIAVLAACQQPPPPVQAAPPIFAPAPIDPNQTTQQLLHSQRHHDSFIGNEVGDEFTCDKLPPKLSICLILPNLPVWETTIALDVSFKR
jgi:hypothetical protein